MQRTTRDPTIALVLGVTAFALAACGSTPVVSGSQSLVGSESIGDSPSKSITATNGPVAQTGPLTGIWESEPLSADKIDTLLRDMFTDAQVDEFERTNPQGFSSYHTEVNQLHFAGDQLVISTSKDSGAAREEWTGTYVIQDADTYMAGGETGKLYITVNFAIHGDRLTLALIQDRLPDNSPWGPSDGIYPRSISKALDDIMNQTVFYEVSSYTRVN
ncbi:MAG: hypothetical protein M3P43_10440 [Actinomycetota bacterium]|nr:hypothetical protein [Actinomycetota bacterium]